MPSWATLSPFGAILGHIDPTWGQRSGDSGLWRLFSPHWGGRALRWWSVVSRAVLVVGFGASELLPALSEPQDLQGGWQAGGGAG